MSRQQIPQSEKDDLASRLEKELVHAGLLRTGGRHTSEILSKIVEKIYEPICKGYEDTIIALAEEKRKLESDLHSQYGLMSYQ